MIPNKRNRKGRLSANVDVDGPAQHKIATLWLPKRIEREFATSGEKTRD